MSWKKRLINSPIIGDITKRVIAMKANSEANNIADHFTKFLEPQVALTDQLREEVFKIRHNVYCEELAFEDVKKGGMEQDEFDGQSIFSLIKHKPSDVYTSCVRVVKSKNDSELLPIEKYCLSAIQNKDFLPSNFKRSEICEISRLAVKSDFRRRQADKFKGAGTGVISEATYSENELRCFPFIAIGLYMAAATMAIDTGIKHVYVMMEPRLARSLKFVGIQFNQIGEAVDYHGIRAPYYINPEIFMENLNPGFKNLYDAIEHEICSQLNQLDLI